MSRTIRARVVAKAIVARNIFGFRLEGLDTELPPADPGAHIDVHLPSNRVRQYSITRATGRGGRYEIGVLREDDGRGGSKELCETIHVGDELTISAPRNNFALHPSHGRYILLAGGIGVTPLLSMARALKDRNAAFELHFCARTPEHAAFREMIDQEPIARHITYHFDQVEGGNPLNLDGFINGLRESDHLYACGPTGFLDALNVATRNWERGRFHQERFAGNLRPLPDDQSGSFTIRLAKSGQEFQVPEDRSILEVLQHAGIGVDQSCLEGVCGTCIVPVLASGEILHRDTSLYPDEQDSNSAIALCVSRGVPGSTIVLDL